MDRVQQLRELVESAKKNGWTFAGTMAVRVTVHKTPVFVVNTGWWTSDTYTCIEALDFTFTSLDRVPICVYKVTRTPWTDRTDQRVSYRKACTLLAQPLSESEIHN
jgi:hypothetical protein